MLNKTPNYLSTSLNLAVNSLINLDVSKLEEIDINENHIDFLNREIFEYLNRINQSMLPTEDAEMIGPMYQVITDAERIGDIAKTIGNITETCYKKQYKLDDTHKEDIKELLALVDEEFELSIEMFTHKSMEHLNRILKLEDDVDQREKKLQKTYQRDIKRRIAKPREGMLYSDLVASLERIGDHATNIAFSILNEDSDEIRDLMEEEHVDTIEDVL